MVGSQPRTLLLARVLFLQQAVHLRLLRTSLLLQGGMGSTNLRDLEARCVRTMPRLLVSLPKRGGCCHSILAHARHCSRFVNQYHYPSRCGT